MMSLSFAGTGSGGDEDGDVLRGGVERSADRSAICGGDLDRSAACGRARAYLKTWKAVRHTNKAMVKRDAADLSWTTSR